MTVELHDVEVRTWPERADLAIVDLALWRIVDHYPLWGDRAAPAWDPLASYQRRAADAIARSESDQDELHMIYTAPAEVTIKLVESLHSRIVLDRLLSGYGLSLETIELARIEDAIGGLYDLDLDDLYQLLVDWADVVEHRLLPGASALAGETWVENSRPEQACNYLWNATGTTDAACSTLPQRQRAYTLFASEVDVPLAEFSFGSLLRWVYYHRTEFSDCEPFELQAVEELRRCAGPDAQPALP